MSGRLDPEDYLRFLTMRRRVLLEDLGRDPCEPPKFDPQWASEQLASIDRELSQIHRDNRAARLILLRRRLLRRAVENPLERSSAIDELRALGERSPRFALFAYRLRERAVRLRRGLAEDVPPPQAGSNPHGLRRRASRAKTSKRALGEREKRATGQSSVPRTDRSHGARSHGAR